MFTESLTVRILGDSSDLQRELESVLSQLDEFQSRLGEVGDGSRELADGLRGVGDAGAPLRQISTQLTNVQRQAQQLSGQTITLNVQPALVSLGQLSASIQAVMAQLAQLSAMSAAPAMGGAGRPMRMGAGFSDGGPVEGPAGLDAVPAWLTAGEFVLNRDSTQRLGTTFLTALNRGSIGTATQTRSTAVPPGPVTTTHNYFGGITVNVTEPGGVNEVVRDLRLQGAALRVRRG
ncbi:MAG TPA: hypothetical protein VM452_04975 [Caulifigura sp.]|jgi:hypothetical protein|nr:hypothetical protein [Caulifigura sp.]